MEETGTLFSGQEAAAKAPPLAVLVAVVLEDGDEMDTDSSLDELEELLKTAGGEAYCRLIQTRQKPEKATYIGSGKLAELAEICRNAEIELVVFDCELLPSQIANIENALENTRVIDRTMLILDIFAGRARTGEGILQVEIANLKYTLPRLIGKGKELSRLGGGIGTRGPGESKLEMDKRKIRQKLVRLEEELARLSRQRDTQRKTRNRSGIFRIAVAGYTNAGKSTLLGALCEEDIAGEDKLFATLDPLTRRLRLPNAGEALITDTVGFINRLPHHLVEAFRSTLEEVLYSDLVLIVMDGADPKFLQKLSITEKVLTELYGNKKLDPAPFLYVINKCDRPESVFNRSSLSDGRESVCVSAKTGAGLDELLKKIEEVASRRKRTYRFLLPHAEGGKLDLLYKNGTVQSVEYLPEGIEITAECDEKLKGMLSAYLANEKEK